VERGGEGYVGHAVSGVSVIDGSRDGIAQRVMELTSQTGADIAYNTVGSPYFAAALESLKVGGRQIVISTPDRNVPFDIQAFYRRDLQLIGVDSLKLDSARCAAVFRELLPGFEDGSLQSFPVSPAAVVPLAQAREAYIKVLEGAQDRPVLAP
jgi:NADPH2:quinone reductase